MTGAEVEEAATAAVAWTYGHRPEWWLARMEAATAGHRTRRAAHHRARELRSNGSTASWHRRRAEGQRERFDRARACGSLWQVRADCGACGASRLRPAGCNLP